MPRTKTGRHHLFIPGPTNVPEPVLNAMHVSSEDMRSADFPNLTLPLFKDLKKIFKTTKGNVFVFPGSGTGAWESAITNTMSPGEKVLIFRFGQFSLLWADMFKRLGLDVDVRDVPWGTGTPAEKIEKILKKDKNHKYKVVCVTQNETATGVSSNVAAVRKAMNAAKHPAMLFVDGVSSIASIDFRMDQWGVDCAISGSQKGFMLPAGLAILAASPKALKAHKKAQLKRCFYSWEDMLATNASGYFPYTPPTPMLRGLRVSIDMLLDEGLENVFARHHRIAEGVRQAVKEGWKLKLCAKGPKWESDTVSAIIVPKSADARKVIATAYNKYNLALGAGLNILAGKVFRIGHLGDLNELQAAAAITGAEMAMIENGIKIKPGSGVAAASKYWLKNMKAPKKARK